MNKKVFLVAIMALALVVVPAALAVKTGVSPILECVQNNGDGTYTAQFGYENYEEGDVIVAVGVDNKFTGGGVASQDQGQTTTFTHPAVIPGRDGRTDWFPNNEFSVDFDGSNLVWTLKATGVTRTATASSSSTACPEEEVPEFGAIAAGVALIGAVAGFAIMRRKN